MKRRKFTSEFKFKVAVEAIAEQRSLPELAKKHQLAPPRLAPGKKNYWLVEPRFSKSQARLRDQILSSERTSYCA